MSREKAPRAKLPSTPMAPDYHTGDPNVRSMTHKEPVCHLTSNTGYKLAILGRHIISVEELPNGGSWITLSTGAIYTVEERYEVILNIWSIALSRIL